MSIFKKAVKTVSNVAKPILKGAEKIVQGKVSEGVGDIAQTSARMGLDISTGGNRQLVNAYTGGLLDTAENAARGNTGDAAKLGVVGGATYLGGPLGFMAANSALANGGSAINAGAAGLLASQGGEMDFLNNILNPNTALGNLAGSYLNGLANNGAKPKPLVVESNATPAASQQLVAVAQPQWQKYALYGGGALALILVVSLVARRR